MKTFQNKKTFLFILIFSFLCNFLPLGAEQIKESNLKSQVLNSTDLAFNGPVIAITRDEMTGIVYVGGNFTSVGQNLGSGVPINIATGQPQNTFPKVDGPVHAVAPDGSGGWYIGGDFTSIEGVTRNHLAHILPDGMLDPSWDPNANEPVYALVISDSMIYIGGQFSKIGDKTRSNFTSFSIPEKD